VFALPARYGGLAIENLVSSAKENYAHYVRESAPWTSKILEQDFCMHGVDSVQKKETNSMKKRRCTAANIQRSPEKS